MDGGKAVRCAQRLIDELVMGCVRLNRRSLETVLQDPELLEARSSLGLSPLFGTCYALWPEGTRKLLFAGADPFEVGLGSALDAVELGLRDAGGGEEPRKNAAEIVSLLVARGMNPALSVSQERIKLLEAREISLAA